MVSEDPNSPTQNTVPTSQAQPPETTPSVSPESAVPDYASAEPIGTEEFSPSIKLINTYDFLSKNMPITVKIYQKKSEFVPFYEVSIASISENTEIILEKIRQELITEVNVGMADITLHKGTGVIEQSFMNTIDILVKKYFPDIDKETESFLTSYLIQKSLGMGNIEILMDDKQLEEIAINSSDEPVWVYHRKNGWLKTNIMIPSEKQIRHYSSMIARKVGRSITVLEPLLDAHLEEGDRANATIMPISARGNTITLRKFSRDPFTITHFLRGKTMSPSAAGLIWTSMEYELSALVAGGTASGKTATLNVLANFFPPTQRIISIEDTRELRLPKFLHWVPMQTRQANPEGKGEISMEDLLVNALRQRPDRILVGEVRRKREAETLFEAIHTGHSVYATFHANNAEEAYKRLTNPPIEVPTTMLPAISMVIIQFRNRRTGVRRTFQIAEVRSDSTIEVIKQYDPKRDLLLDAQQSKSLMDTLTLYTGYSKKEIAAIIYEKEIILKYMVKNSIDHVDDVGRVIAEYYTDKPNLLKHIKLNRKLS